MKQCTSHNITIRACLIVVMACFITFYTPKSVYAQNSLTSMQQTGEALTLKEVMIRTSDTNPTLEAARAQLRSVQERLPQAYANFKPTITANAGVTVAEQEGSAFNFAGTPEAEGTTSKDISIRLTQPVFRGGRSLAQLSAARYIIAAQEALYRQTLQSVMLDAARAFINVRYTRDAYSLAQNNRDLISEQEREIKARFDVGELTLTDVAQARARLAAADADMLNVRADLREAEANFEKITGFVPPPLSDANVYLNIPETQLEALNMADTYSPAILAAENVQRAAEADVDNVFGELLPEVGFTAEWARTYDPQPGLIPEQTNTSAALNARIPLYQAGSVRSRLREAKEISSQRAEEVRENRAAVRQDLIANWERIDALESSLKARKIQIQASTLAREGVYAEEQVGERTVLDTLNAENEFLQAGVNELATARDALLSRLTLAAILGLLTPDNIGVQHDKLGQGSFQKQINKQILQTDVDRLQNYD